MTTTTLTLGSVIFSSYEIPQRINFGGSQALAVHQLVGGQRIIDSMGRLDDDISWSGIMFETTAVQRAKFLDQMRTGGLAWNLSWSSFSFSVVIKDFRANFERTYQIPYSITVTVIQDLTKPIPILVPTGYNDAIQDLLTQAQDLALLASNANVTSALALLAVAINNIPNLGFATEAQLASIVTPLLNAQGITTSAITSLNGLIFG